MKTWPLVLVLLTACGDPSAVETHPARTYELVSAQKVGNHTPDEYRGCAVTWLSGSLILRPQSTGTIEEGSFEQHLKHHITCATTPPVDEVTTLNYQGSYKFYPATEPGEQASVRMEFTGTDVAAQSNSYGDTVRVVFGLHGNPQVDPTVGVDSNWMFNFVPVR